MPSDGACPQDHTQRSIQAPPTKKPTMYLADGTESALTRPPTLHKQPPALPPKPFARLPNHVTGALLLCTFTMMFLTLHALMFPCLRLCCRRWPSEVAMYVGEVISSSTSKEAHDLHTCRKHGALVAHLSEVPRCCQPCSNGRAPPAVRDATCPPPPTQPNHRRTQQDPGPHHAEVWEVSIALTALLVLFSDTLNILNQQQIFHHCFSFSFTFPI